MLPRSGFDPPASDSTSKLLIGALEKEILFLTVDYDRKAVAAMTDSHGGGGTKVTHSVDLECPSI